MYITYKLFNGPESVTDILHTSFGGEALSVRVRDGLGMSSNKLLTFHKSEFLVFGLILIAMELG